MFDPTARRTTRFAAAATATLWLAAPLAAQPDAPAAPTHSAFFGRWQLDLTRMPANYGPPPKRVVFTFAAADGGNWRTAIDITVPDDTHRLSTLVYRPDGTAAAGAGDTREADTAAVMVPAPGVLVLNLVKNRMPGSVRVYTLSPNGREMTESAAAVDDKGSPFIRNFHFKRAG